MDPSKLAFTFEQAQEKVKNLSGTPLDRELLKLYGLYKQAIKGDITKSRPGFWNPKGQAKHDAWFMYKGLTGKTAEEQYVKYVEFMIIKYKLAN